MMSQCKAIYLDMDGTIADLYSVEGWLGYLLSHKTKPYREAKPLVNMRKLGKLLNQLQAQGYVIGIVSWLSRDSSVEYNEAVTQTKLRWLERHLGSVDWDTVQIIDYGTPKSSVVEFPGGILFDDEEKNRTEWKNQGVAFDVGNILEILENLL